MLIMMENLTKQLRNTKGINKIIELHLLINLNQTAVIFLICWQRESAIGSPLGSMMASNLLLESFEEAYVRFISQ